MIKDMTNKVNELAAQVVPSEFLESFLNLDLKAKLTGIMTFAHLSNDTEMIDFALKAIKYLEAN